MFSSLLDGNGSTLIWMLCTDRKACCMPTRAHWAAAAASVLLNVLSAETMLCAKTSIITVKPVLVLSRFTRLLAFLDLSQFDRGTLGELSDRTWGGGFCLLAVLTCCHTEPAGRHISTACRQRHLPKPRPV